MVNKIERDMELARSFAERSFEKIADKYELLYDRYKHHENINEIAAEYSGWLAQLLYVLDITNYEKRRKTMEKMLECMIFLAETGKSTDFKGEDRPFMGKDRPFTGDAGQHDALQEQVPYSDITFLYNSICISFPKLNILSEARKKAIRARCSQYDTDDFKRLFEMAESSPFLKGSNDRNWRATFDWLIKESNMAKVLDGNYTGIIQPHGLPGEKDGTAHPDGGIWMNGKQVLGVKPK